MTTTNQAPQRVTAQLRPDETENAPIKFSIKDDQPRVDSRVIAEQIGIQHKNVLGVIDNYLSDLEELGQVAFETRKSKGRPTRNALLNEDQSYLILAYSKNTPLVRLLKLNLVKAFKLTREGQAIQKDYLPFYHSMHDSVKELAKQAHANGSTTPEHLFHTTYNRLINKAFGLSAGNRKTITSQERVFISAAQAIVTRSLEAGLKANINHRELYQQIKEQILAYAESVKTPCLTGDSNQGMEVTA